MGIAYNGMAAERCCQKKNLVTLHRRVTLKELASSLVKHSRVRSCMHLGVGQALQQVVLQLLEGDGVLSQLAHQAAGLLLQVGPLMVDHLGQQLLLQPHLCHTEVDQRGLSCNLGLVVRVGQLGLQI